MSSWFLLPLGDGLTAHSALTRIEAEFATLVHQGGEAADMAIFTKYQSSGDLHCSVTAYFSPATADVAAALNAMPCQRPNPDGLELVCGSDGCWEPLFGDRSE